MFYNTEFSNERIKVERLKPIECGLLGCDNHPVIKLSLNTKNERVPFELLLCEECLLDLMTFLRRADDELNTDEKLMHSMEEI